METRVNKSEVMRRLGNFVSVRNARSTNYNDVPNQFIITFENGEVFQSYDTFIGANIRGKLYLTDDHNYSRTTSRYCGRWCGLDCAERRAGIAKGEIILIVD